MKRVRVSILSIAIVTAGLAAVPTAALASDSSACEAARAGNNFTAWFYRTFMC